MVHLDTLAQADDLELLANLELLEPVTVVSHLEKAQLQEELSMFTGGGLFVPVTRELSCCILGELEGQMEEQIFSACQPLQNIFKSPVEAREFLYMEWSIEVEQTAHCPV